eukprot:SAG31_NODE_1480_length_8180_cov_5.458978_5_plen_250_part_00
MLHLGVSGVGQFHYFNPTVQPFAPSLAQHASMNAVLQELTAYLGGAFPQSPMVENNHDDNHSATAVHDAGDNRNARGWIEDRNIRWNDTFFLSGSAVVAPSTFGRAPGYRQRVWRLTCAKCDWADCTATSSVTALKDCAKEIGGFNTVKTVPVGLWLHGIGLAPCTVTFQHAWICNPPYPSSSSKERRCPKLEPEAIARQSDFGSWILQDLNAKVSVSCVWENASRLLGPDGTAPWPLNLSIAAASSPR